LNNPDAKTQTDVCPSTVRLHRYPKSDVKEAWIPEPNVWFPGYGL